MKYPKLVRERDCKTDIHVVLYEEEVTENGEPIIVFEDDLKCNYQESAKKVLTSEKVMIQLSANAYFSFDFVPSLLTISSGKVIVFGETRQIYKGIKARNPDGTVNYVKLEVV